MTSGCKWCSVHGALSTDYSALCLWRDDQIHFYSEKQAGQLYLHFYKIYYSHSRCTLAHKLISPVFAKHSHSVARVKGLAWSMAHDVILGKLSAFQRRLDSDQNSQFWPACRESAKTQSSTHLLGLFGPFYPKGARTYQRYCTLSLSALRTVHLCTVLTLLSHTGNCLICCCCPNLQLQILTSEVKRMQHEVKN